MTHGLVALLIVLIVIVGSILTHRCEEFMIGGSLVGAAVLFKGSFLTQWCTMLQETISENVWIVVVCGLFGSLIALLQTAKGNYGFSKLVSKLCNSERKTLLTTFILGILIFVDDYLNVLSIGACMKGVYDKRKIPRETLAFMLDSTGAPVCVLLPFSTWAVFYASLFIDQPSVQAYGFTSGMKAYLSAIPFCFYPIIILLIVFLFCMGIMPKLGGMKKAYKRVEETGKVYSDASRKYNHENRAGYEEDGNIWDFVIPMAVLVAIAIITGDLLLAVVLAIACCMLMYLPRKIIAANEIFGVIVKGFADMLPTLTLLVLAFLLQKVTEQLNMTDYIIDLAQPLLTGSLFPMITIITGDLLLAVVLAIACCMLMYLPRKIIAANEIFGVIVKGFADMLPTLTLLVLAFLLQKVTEQLNMTDYIIDLAQPLLTGSLFPMITFILVAALCFATGSFWGMSAVVAPIVFPLGAAISANPVLIMAAIISGGAFGSHACFYCDATLLSSNSAGIDNMEHAVSQLPYVMIAAMLSIVGFLICGFVV